MSLQEKASLVDNLKEDEIHIRQNMTVIRGPRKKIIRDDNTLHNSETTDFVLIS